MAEPHNLRTTRFWLIEPAASLADSRWQDRAVWRVVVAAPSAAMARLTAAAWTLPGPDEVQIGNESDSPLAGFDDEKLYFVRQIDPKPEWLASVKEGESRVIDAELLRPPPEIVEI